MQNMYISKCNIIINMYIIIYKNKIMSINNYKSTIYIYRIFKTAKNN